MEKEISEYIEKAKPFAKPILEHIRSLVHKVCPEVVEEIKWGFPSFNYKGLFCGMAAFKEHCTFGFWKGALMKDPEKILENKDKAMGHLGRITGLEDLPSDKILISYLKEAMRLNDEGIKVPKRKPAAKEELEVPVFFIKALKKNSGAYKNFEEFSYSKKKEYVEWITEAKQEATREKRIQTAIEWIQEGKSRNWKYE
ncbi:MAG TPA: YdeI/OmpD-associated family protein [Chlamydiales bacterium]|nr:YdeI/OmpD-associated family protein [Chlamydiales bacterium]